MKTDRVDTNQTRIVLAEEGIQVGFRVALSDEVGSSLPNSSF